MAWHPESLWTEDFTPLASILPTPHVHVDVVAAMTAAALETHSIRIGTAVTEAVRRHPAVLAQEMLTLHHFSNGRVILGIGAGEAENIIPYGLDFVRPASRLEEAIEIIQLLWQSEGPVNYSGNHFNLERAVLGLGSFEGTFPEIWIAAHGPRMCRIAGRFADGWIPTSMPLESYAERWHWIEQAAHEFGRNPSQITSSLFTYVVPANDHDRAHELLKHPLVKGFCLAASDEAFRAAGSQHPLGSGARGLLEYIPAGLSRSQAQDLIDAIPEKVVHDYIWHGNLEDLKIRARKFAEVGMTHILPWNVAFFGDLEIISESFAILDQLCRDLAMEGQQWD